MLFSMRLLDWHLVEVRGADDLPIRSGIRAGEWSRVPSGVSRKEGNEA